MVAWAFAGASLITLNFPWSEHPDWLPCRPDFMMVGGSLGQRFPARERPDDPLSHNRQLAGVRSVDVTSLFPVMPVGSQQFYAGTRGGFTEGAIFASQRELAPLC